MKHWAVQSWFEPYIWLVTNITAENENNCTQPKVLGCCQRAELFSNLMFSSVCKLQLWGYFSDYVTVNLIIYVLAGCPSYEQFDSNPDGAPSSHLGHKETRESKTQRHAPHVESACRDKEDSRCQTEVEEEKRVAAKEAASEAVGRNWCDRHSSGLVGQQQGRTDGLKRNVIPHGWYAAWNQSAAWREPWVGNGE